MFERRYDDERIFVAVNIGSQQEHIDLAREHHGSFWNLLSDERIEQHSTNSIHIPSYSALIVKAE